MPYRVNGFGTGYYRQRDRRRPAGSFIGTRLAVVLGILLLVGGLAVGGTALWKQWHADLWFDNGLKQPVRVALDGESFDLPAGPPLQKNIRPGDHRILVTDAKGREIEHFTAHIPKLGLLDALTADRFFLYDVAEAHFYQRETISYAANGSDLTYKRTIIAFQRFFEQDDVNLVFQQAPEFIKVDSHQTGTTKQVAFNVAPLDANQVGVIWFGEEKVKEAEDAFRRVLATQPCSAVAHDNLLQVLDARGRHEEAVADARQWLACPDAGVRAHRGYQDAQIALGRRNEVLAEYQARLATHPESGMNHYLYGRLLNDPERELPLYQEAIRREPGLWWALVAQAHVLLSLERDAEAADALERALRMPDHDPAIIPLYAMAAVGAGTAEHASEVIQSMSEGKLGYDPAIWQARWLLLLARGEYGFASQILDVRGHQTGERDPELWAFKVQLLRLEGDETGLSRALTEGGLRPEAAALVSRIRGEQALGAGQWQEAVKFLDELKTRETTPTSRILAASALLLSGDREQATERLAALDAELAPRAAQGAETAAFLAMVRHLEGRTPAEAVLASTRQSGYNLLPQAYFVLAVAREAAGDKAGAQALYEKSRRTALDLDVLYFTAAARAKALAV